MTSTANRTPEFMARVAELSGLTWTKIRDAAIAVGYEKAETDSWADAVDPIIQAEFLRDGKQIQLETLEMPTLTKETPGQDGSFLTSEPLSPKEVKEQVEEVASKVDANGAVFATKAWVDNGVPVCPRCGEKYRFDRNNKQLCPIELSAAECPLLVSASALNPEAAEELPAQFTRTSDVDRRIEPMTAPLAASANTDSEDPAEVTESPIIYPNS